MERQVVLSRPKMGVWKDRCCYGCCRQAVRVCLREIWKLCVLLTCHGVLNAQLGTLSTTAQKGFGGGAAVAAAEAEGWCSRTAADASVATPALRVSLLDACTTAAPWCLAGCCWSVRGP